MIAYFSSYFFNRCLEITKHINPRVKKKIILSCEITDYILDIISKRFGHHTTVYTKNGLKIKKANKISHIL